MEEYIASPDYKIDNDHKGVCFGIQHFVEEDVPKGELATNYTFTFHYPDQAIGWSAWQFPKAVPNQANPVTSPYQGAPDLKSYIRYQHNGWSFLQNLIGY